MSGQVIVITITAPNPECPEWIVNYDGDLEGAPEMLEADSCTQGCIHNEYGTDLATVLPTPERIKQLLGWEDPEDES